MKFRLLPCILFLLPATVQGQNSELKQLLDSAKVLWYKDFNKTDQLVKQAEKLISLPGQTGYESDLLHIYDARIQSCNAFSKFQLWRQYLNEFDLLLSKYKDKLDPEEFSGLRLRNERTRAQFYFAINDDSKALEIFNSLLNELKKRPESQEVCAQLNLITNEIAGIHHRKGEYEAAINLHLSNIHFDQCANPPGTGYNSVTYRGIGLLYLEKREYKLAKKYLKIAEDSLQNLLNTSLEKGARIALSLYETQAIYYQRINRNDSALLAMKKALPLLKLKNVSNEFKGRINRTLGNLYTRSGNFSEARNHYNQAEGFFLNLEPFYLGGLYLNIAELYEREGKEDLALDYCTKAIEKLKLNFKPDSDGNPGLQQITYKKQLFSVLQKKSRLEEKLSVTRNDAALLQRALNTNRLALALLDSTANEFSLDKDKIILSEQSFSTFEDGIRISNRLYQKTNDEKYFSNVIAFIEKSKGNLLLENLRIVNRFSGINQEWLDREKELKGEMLWTEQELYKAEANGVNNDLQKNRERYAAIKRDYSSLIDRIKKEAPDYYKLRFDHSVVSPETIQQKLLKPNEALIEFFVGDSILTVAGFTNGKKYLNVKPILPGFIEKMNQFRAALTTGKSDFIELSKIFNDFLLKDCLAELGSDINSIIIIPDGLLGYLPFEVLIQSTEPKVVFLNDKMSVHYANSATYLMEQMQRKASESKNFFAGFVSSGSIQPSNQVAARDQKWTALQGAEEEVKAITDLFNSSFTVFSPASKHDFISKASDYKILHFAMHSSMNDENPMMSVMVFSETDTIENLLTAIELYGMKLNSELAVLSACNTGVGQLHRGEGIMSFSRAFAYAGVPSAVISLWKVPDVATSKIMVSFYSHLQNGESKDKALQLARQDFVRENPEMAHPYYWSGFILTGNSSPLSFPQSNWWLWITLFVMVILLTLYFRKKYLKNVKPSNPWKA